MQHLHLCISLEESISHISVLQQLILASLGPLALVNPPSPLETGLISFCDWEFSKDSSSKPVAWQDSWRNHLWNLDGQSKTD